jgi:polyribonucleotide nucleotidyltransferase
MELTAVKTFRRRIGDRDLIIETGHLAGQANGAVTVRYGDTVVLVTACMGPPREGVDFLPLLVDFEERLYAAGKIPGSWFRREGRPSTAAILTARLTDRPLRPLFPKGFRNDVQIIVTALSADQENDHDILAIIGASAALSISDIPFHGPVGATRIGYLDGEFLINPTFEQRRHSSLDLVVASTKEAVVMVECGARELPEELVVEAMTMAHQVNQESIALQEEMVAQVGKPKASWTPAPLAPEVVEAVRQLVAQKGWDLVWAAKDERQAFMDQARQEVLASLGDTFPQDQLLRALEEEVRTVVRRRILEEGRRPDGRLPDEMRPVSAAVGLLPRTHGSGLFTRGETQVLTIATLGSLGERQELDTIEPEESKRFIHHYNFPPFSTGEVRPLRTPSRREIGHGALAERALEPVIPSEEEFPYTIRLVSEVLSSNGSTSMASVCGSTLSLMDAGVPIKAPVAGVAMGLVMEGERYVILTDIAGLEDHYGDMDFKVAGTAEGITALQLDIKREGLPISILEQAMRRAREARMHILRVMLDTIPEARAELSPYAPRMFRIQIPVDKIGAVIGPGGRVIRSIIDETKCTIDVEDDGTVYVGSPSEEAARRAIEIIEGLTRDVRVGEVYTGKVTRIVPFGAFVEILPGKEGLVRTEELADYRVRRPEDVVRVGDEIMVMVTGVDSYGRINLSRRAVLEGRQPQQQPPPQQGRRPTEMRPRAQHTPPRPPRPQPPRRPPPPPPPPRPLRP